MEKSSKIPKIKKNIKAFLNSEDGKITKKSIIKAGIILGTIGSIVDANMASAHENFSITETGHISHGSYHGAHGSHGSHGQW